MSYGENELNQIATAATASAVISGAGRANFSWSTPVKKAWVQNEPSSGETLYVLWGATTGAAVSGSAWDAVLEPGDAVVTPDSLMWSNVDIWSTGAVTYGTDFVVKGWT